MIKLNETIVLKGIEYKRIDKRIANKFYTQGIKVYTCPNKMNLFSDWATLFISPMDRGHYTFNRWIHEVMYYNCNSEVGNYLNYYIVNVVTN